MAGGAGILGTVDQAAASSISGSKKRTGKRSTADQFKRQKTQYDAHRLYVKIHFDDVEMDFVLQWILGSTTFGGCEIGEAFYVVGNIEEGSPTSWQQEWEKMARKLESRGKQAASKGHKVSASESFMKASNYYRTALVSMLPNKPKFKELGNRCRSCLKMAGRLLDPPMEYFAIPFEKTVLPGYFQKVDNSGEKRKTLIMIGGAETFVEEMYFYIAPAAIKRGYNFLTVDIPGQGMLPLEGKFFRPDTEVPIKAVLDYALGKPEIDPERLAMYGISGGGYFVPRAATVDKRIKACVVNSVVTDVYKQFANMPNAKATPEELKKWGAFKRATAGVVSWRWGLDPSNIIGLPEKARGCEFDPAKVTCPVLILVGEGEYANQEVKRQINACLKALPNPKKKFVMTRADQGASSHCIGGNRSLMSEVVFDWLDEIFKA
ncbi:MAG: alpha/beta hydrolase [Proteobacteria bacterium]|nr:alpha/beta hydrolase [Pseudomonadota bacterium]